MAEEGSKNARELIEFGAEIVGAAAGGVIGFFAGGPGGAVGGAVAGPLLTKGLEIASDFALRSLSRRERIRAGAGLGFAYANIKNRLARGETPRDDGFFEGDRTRRPASDEILEGTLHKCMSEHEERKLKYIGNIYANVAFMPQVSAYNANWLLQMVSGLTYRQLCILALVHRKEHKAVSWGPNDGDPAFQMEYEDLEQLFDRDHGLRAGRTQVGRGEELRIVGLSRVGKLCFDVMGLADISEDDLKVLGPHFPQAFQ